MLQPNMTKAKSSLTQTGFLSTLIFWSQESKDEAERINDSIQTSVLSASNVPNTKLRAGESLSDL